MDSRYNAIRRLVLEHFNQYPKAQLSDFIKLLYQRELGGEHLISDEAESFKHLSKEYSACKGDRERLLYEPIGNGLCRLHLEACAWYGVSLRTLHRFFISTSHQPWGTRVSLEQTLACLPQLTQAGDLPFDSSVVQREVDAYIASGCPSIHHSQRYRLAYQPRYRVVDVLYAAYLPLFLAIDAAFLSQDRVVLAIDGDSGAGKSTLAQRLTDIYDCTVLHMDDFFLPPERKTTDRLSVPGGNVDYERFLSEAEAGLHDGTPFIHQKFDCAAGHLTKGMLISPKPLIIVEGVYSLHPVLQHLFDLKILLQVDSQEQSRRILQRNGPQMLERFLTEWIPLEQLYFSSLRPDLFCDFIFPN